MKVGLYRNRSITQRGGTWGKGGIGVRFEKVSYSLWGEGGIQERISLALRSFWGVADHCPTLRAARNFHHPLQPRPPLRHLLPSMRQKKGLGGRPGHHMHTARRDCQTNELQVGRESGFWVQESGGGSRFQVRGCSLGVLYLRGST